MCSWLQGQVPPHPFFNQEWKINKITTDIKSELSFYLISGLSRFKKELEIDQYLIDSLQKKPLCWDLAIKSLRYGVIYWLSRDEAKQHIQFARKHKDIIDDIADLIGNNQNINRIFNYAVHCWVLDEKRTVQFSKEFIPKYAIYSVGRNQIYVREDDFIKRTPEDSFQEKKALYDLHDFAHATAATLSPTLYRSYYFDNLISLPGYYRELIKSPNLKTSKANPFSDGVIFSEILTSMFNALDYHNLSYNDLVVIMANVLSLYYLNKAAFLHGSTGNLIRTNRVISVEELATLVQNKAYELPASEIEQRLFTRGGEVGDDPLNHLKASERIMFLADSNRWLYFEMRNTLKHKAHKEAYKIVAKYLLDCVNNKLEEELLKKIINNIDYIDFYQNNRINLWCELKNSLLDKTG